MQENCCLAIPRPVLQLAQLHMERCALIVLATVISMARVFAEKNTSNSWDNMYQQNPSPVRRIFNTWI